jgi:hypothetical protein
VILIVNGLFLTEDYAGFGCGYGLAGDAAPGALTCSNLILDLSTSSLFARA